MVDEKDHGAELAAVGSDTTVVPTPQLSHVAYYSIGITAENAAEIYDGFSEFSCAMSKEGEERSIARIVAAVRVDALDIVNEAITAKLTPAMNTGRAMSALILVAEALRELRTAFGNDPRLLSEASPSVPSEAPK